MERKYETLEEGKEVRHPEEDTWPIYRICVWWLSPVIDIAYKRPLNEDDLWEPPTFCEISSVSQRLSDEWSKECERQDGIKPSLLRALFHVFRADVIRSGFFQFCFMVLQLTQPFLIGNLLDEISSPTSTLKSGLLAALPLGCVAFLSSAALITAFYQLRRTGICIRGSMMMKVYSHALLITSTARQQSSIGTTANLMSIDSEKLVLSYLFLHYLWHGPITVIVVMAILAYEIGALTAFTGIMFLLLVFPIQRKIAMMIGGYRRETIKETDKRVNLINEALQAIRAIKFYAWEESIFRRVQEVRAREVDKLLKYLSVNSVLRDLNYVNPAITAMVIFLVYVFLGSYDGSNEKNQLSTGQVLTVLAYLNICRFPLNLLSQSMKAVSDAQVSLTRLTDFFLLPTLKLRIISEGEGTKDMGSPMVSLREASFSWTKPSTKGETLSPLIGEAAQTHFSLDNLSFELFPGELIAVIGAVGSGKSTLASAILGEVPLVSGESKVNGRIAFSAQIPWIQNLTVRENILFCSDRDDPSLEARYTASLEQAALLPDLSILPAGDATEIGERGINLSGGQKARVSLCRVLLAAPHSDITILDDPFSAVDGATGNWMFHKGVLEGLAGKTRIILLNSHLHLLSQFDRILILDDGKPIALASPSEIMTNYKEIYLKIIGSIGRQHNGEEDKEDTMTDTPTPPTEVQSQSLLEETTSNKTGTNEKSFKKESSFSSSTVTNISPATVAPVSTVTSETAPTSNGSAEGKLIIAENRAVGGIALRAYLSYFGAGFWDVSNLNHLSDKNQISWAGLGVVCAILFGFAITQFIRVCIDIELLNWASKGHWETDSPFMIGYLVLIVLLCLLVDIRTRIQTYFAGLTSLNIHHMMLRKVLNAPIPLYFDVVTVGNMLNKFGKDTETIDMNIPEFFYQTCLQFFILLSVVILCIWSLPLLIFYFIPLFGILIFQARKYSYVSRDLKRLEAISRTPIYSSFTETLIGIETIRAYGVVSRFYSRHLINMNRYQKFVFHSTMSQIWLTTRMEFGGCLILVGSSILAIIFKEFFEIQATKVGLALVYSLQVTAMLQRNVTLFIELQTYFTSVERVMEYADIPQETAVSHPQSETPQEFNDEEKALSSAIKLTQKWPTKGQIEFRNVWMRYRPTTPDVLKGVSFVVTGGERVGICGRTGSGKSSTIQALFRIVEISRGTILIDGIDIQSVPLSILRKKLAVIPQDPVILRGDLRYQLDPFEEYSDEAIWNVLEHVNMATVVRGMSLGLKEQIAENGENLSQGQKQLLCIARALLRDARVLIMDEATSAVDQHTDDFIQSVLREQAQQRGTTVLTIAHRLHTIADFDKILVLGDGEVLEYDSPEALLATNSEFSQMLSDYHSLHSHPAEARN